MRAPCRRSSAAGLFVAMLIVTLGPVSGTASLATSVAPEQLIAPAGVATTSPVPAAKRPPSRPRSVQVTPRDRSARVTWKAPRRLGSHPITAYVIQRAIGSGAWATVAVVAARQRAATIGPLPTTTTVWVRVAARSRGGTSPWSVIRTTVLPAALQVSMGESSTCALMPDRSVECWGGNTKGQLGIGNSGVSRIPVPVRVPGLSDIREITSGRDHHCARRGDGTVWCWGDSLFGQLTIAGAVNHRMSPVEIPGVARAAQISAGAYHTCLRTAGGAVECWGVNGDRQLGAATVDDIATPLTSGAVEVRAGGFHTCARLSSGSVQCWGKNTAGQAGGTPSTERATPTAVAGIAGANGLALGESHTCVLLDDATARCFGDGSSGQLGDGSTAADTSAPQTVIDLGPITSLAAGRSTTCALYRDGRVRCWGTNFYGTFGNGSSGNSSSTPVLSEFGPATSVAQGWSHGCSIGTDGHVRCAGRNHDGQLGTATTTNSATPASPQGL